MGRDKFVLRTKNNPHKKQTVVRNRATSKPSDEMTVEEALEQAEEEQRQEDEEAIAILKEFDEDEL